jgi:hypothetical protein
MDYEKEFRVEDIPYDKRSGDPNLWRKVAERFGPEVVLFIAKEAGGDKVQYIPTVDKLLRPAILRAYPAHTR